MNPNLLVVFVVLAVAGVFLALWMRRDREVVRSETSQGPLDGRSPPSE